jgi:hypothetical protein
MDGPNVATVAANVALLRVHDKKVITLLSVRIGAPKNPESVH